MHRFVFKLKIREDQTMTLTLIDGTYYKTKRQILQSFHFFWDFFLIFPKDKRHYKLTSTKNCLKLQKKSHSYQSSSSAKKCTPRPWGQRIEFLMLDFLSQYTQFILLLLTLVGSPNSTVTHCLICALIVKIWQEGDWDRRQ